MKSWLEKKLAAFRTVHCMGRALLCTSISDCNFSDKTEEPQRTKPGEAVGTLGSESGRCKYAFKLGGQQRSVVLHVPRSVKLSHGQCIYHPSATMLIL